MDGTDRHAPGRVAPNPQFIKIEVSPGHRKRTSACSDRSRGKGMGESRQAGSGGKAGGTGLGGGRERAGSGEAGGEQAGWEGWAEGVRVLPETQRSS